MCLSATWDTERSRSLFFCTTVMALGGLFLGVFFLKKKKAALAMKGSSRTTHLNECTLFQRRLIFPSFIIDVLDRPPRQQRPKGHRAVTLLGVRVLPDVVQPHPDTSLQTEGSIFLRSNFSLHAAMFRPLVPFTFTPRLPESCCSSDRVQATVNLSPPPPLSAPQIHLPGCQMRGKTRGMWSTFVQGATCLS